MDNKLSNILGVKLPPWLYKQLKLRSAKNSEQKRNNNSVRYLEGKTAWVRLVSSIDIESEKDLAYFRSLGATGLNKPSDLAKQFVLFAGTSKYINDRGQNWLRTGVYDPNKAGGNPAYGILGEEEIRQFGYRPMPGITGVTISTQGRLGSVRAATINFKCWDRNQLDIIDALYFKLGYTMFLEWGHVNYFSAESPGVLRSSEIWMMDPFENGLEKERILSQIAENVRSSEGNYDAMLGMTTNFNFTYNQEGGYDCQIKLMALGVLADSTKINHTSNLAGILGEQLKLYRESAEAARLKAEAAAAEQLKKKIDNLRKIARNVELNENGDLIIKNPSSAYNNVKWTEYLKVNNVTEEEVKSYGIEVGNKKALTNFTTEEILKSNDLETTIQGKKVKQSDYYYSFGFGGSQPNEKNIWIGKGENQLVILQSKGVTIPLKNEIDPSLRVKLNSSNLSTLLNSASLDTINSRGSGYVHDLGFVIKGDVKNPDKNYFVGLSMLQRVDVVSPDNPDEPIVDDPNAKDTSTDLEDNYAQLNHFADADGTYDYPVADFLRDIRKIVPTLTWKFKDGSFKSIPSENESGFNENAAKNLAHNAVFGLGGYRGFYALLANYTFEKFFKQKESGAPKKLTLRVQLQLTTNDTNLVESITQVKEGENPEPEPEKTEQVEQTQQGKEENTAQTENPDAKKSPLSNLSSIEVALRAIQVHSLVRALNGPANQVIPIPLGDPTDILGDKSFIQQLFSDGIFSEYITQLVQGKYNGANEAQFNDPTLRPLIAAQYGYATNLLSNREKISKFKPVDFNELFTSYVIPYEINQSLEEGTQVNHPVYIPLGFFLSLLNHNCVIYDTGKEGTSKKPQTPLSYIDFNPNHNFCLSLREHLSTDPFTALIPFEGQDSDFVRIFDPAVLLDENTIKKPDVAPETEGEDNQNNVPTTTPIWKPRSSNNDIRDQVSGVLCPFKVKTGDGNVNPYRGRIMNILLNVDYLMGLIKGEANKDEENRVTLKPVIEQVLSSLNKCLGNVNIFRFSYVDAGNVHQITDDQIVPADPSEEETLSSKTKQEPIPLVGETSIAKSVDLKTEVSSKLANMIAISANSKDKQSALGSNGDNFGAVNELFVDRYIPNRGEPGSNTGSLDGKIDMAVKFNNAIKSFYNSISPDQGSVSTATSYYVDRMSKVKNNDKATRASAMIPVSLNFKTDGISGFAMGHAFTVPEILLPYTYSSRVVKGEEDKIEKVGFVVTGLDHSIEGNVWDTSVKTQMIFLKNPDDYIPSKEIQRLQGAVNLGAAVKFESTTPLPISQNVDSNLSAIKKALIKLGVTNKPVVVASLANAMKETGGVIVEEKVNYSKTSPKRIREIFGSRMNGLSDQQISDLTKNKYEFVERIYGVRSGQVGKNLGNDKEGDGNKYLGRGFIQLTGKANYSRYSKKWFGDDRLVQDPSKLNNVEAAAGVAAAFIQDSLSRKAQSLGLSQKLSSNTITQEEANILVTSIIAGKVLNRKNLNEIFTEIVARVDGYSKTIEKKYDKL